MGLTRAEPTKANAAPTVAPPRASAPPARRAGLIQAAPAPLRLPAGGQALPAPVQATLEQRLGADLSAVRVHDDPRAAQAAANLSARAFTYGQHIALGAGERPTDLGLMAHEVAHVVQQRGAPTIQRSAPGQSDPFEREAEQASAAVVRGETFAVQQRTSGERVQRLGLSDILDGLASLAANVPGFTLLTVIIGRNPITMRTVERNFTNLLRGFMGLIPGGEILFQVLNRYGIVERIGTWVEQQMGALGLTYDYLRGRFTAFTDSLSWRDIFSPGDVWRRAEAIFTEPITRIRNFISRLISQAITWLKETFMQPLSDFCREIPGYGLVTVLLGRDPFTGAAVPRTALNLVRAFAEFIPGGTEKVNQLVESRALQRAYEWFIQETQARNLTWARVVGTFQQAWDSLRLEDVLSPIETLRRIVNIFRPLMGDLIGFAGAALMKLLELIFEAVMGAGGARILAILKRARATFLIIIQNPVGFLRNLLGAVGQGVRQFMRNILQHLQQGVIAWLTGPVARAGIQMPERWDLRGIIGFVLQILGLTWPRVRQKLVRLLGERVVATLEAGFQLLQEIREKGLVQALRDRVSEFFGQLRDAALGSIRSFIQQRLVMAGITQLISLLNPVGAVIQAIIKTYTTIQFFIQRINQILDLVESIVNSIAAIASGSIGAAAALVERTMARTIPIILDFLARFIGLGDVGGHVQRTIQGLQARVDAMLDRAVEWIRTMAQRLATAVVGGVRAVAQRIRQWWQLRKAFTTQDGEQHSLYFQGQGRGTRFILASLEQNPRDFLERVVPPKLELLKNPDGSATPAFTQKEAARVAALAACSQIERLTSTLSARPVSPQEQNVLITAAPEIEQINTLINTMSVHIAIIGFKAGAGARYPDLPTPVSSSSLSATAQSIPDMTDKEKRLLANRGRGEIPPNRAAGHIWIRLKTRTSSLSNFGATARVTSGGFRDIGSAEMTDAVAQAIGAQQANLRAAGVTIKSMRYQPGAFRGAERTADTEAYVLAIARQLKSENPSAINRVDVRVYTVYDPCKDCQAKASLNAIGAYPPTYQFIVPASLGTEPTGDVEFYDSNNGDGYTWEWQNQPAKQGRAKKKAPPPPNYVTNYKDLEI